MKTKLQRSVTLALALALIAVVPVLALTASSPVSDGGITPYIIDGANPGGNRTCAEVGLAFFDDADYYEFSSDKVDYEDDAFQGTFPAGLTVNTDGTYVSWSSTFGIGAVIVKGTNDANVYVYDPQAKSDSGLASPSAGKSGGPGGLSNITFCWNPEDDDEGQWCSPGYWRQTHHLDSWAATGISPDELYSAYFAPVSLSKKALSEGANANPTLWEVLQSPQWYGGEAFNNVGDLLSEAHPDVDFNGERIGDSCPLN
jgi:hypothetical protein